MLAIGGMQILMYLPRVGQKIMDRVLGGSFGHMVTFLDIHGQLM
jgi:hypothetical protein